MFRLYDAQNVFHQLCNIPGTCPRHCDNKFWLTSMSINACEVNSFNSSTQMNVMSSECCHIVGRCCQVSSVLTKQNEEGPILLKYTYFWPTLYLLAEWCIRQRNESLSTTVYCVYCVLWQIMSITNTSQACITYLQIYEIYLAYQSKFLEWKGRISHLFLFVFCFRPWQGQCKLQFFFFCNLLFSPHWWCLRNKNHTYKIKMDVFICLIASLHICRLLV